MERGSSGLYVYGIFSHSANAGAAGYGENRYITKLNHDFNWISVDKDRNLLECTPLDWGRGVQIHAKEQRILSTGYYKNSVEHKYSYNAVQYKIPAYGWSSTKDHIGVYFINPTTEYLSGGAAKLELVCHFDANDNPDPIILDYWCAGHYAGGAGCNIPAGEEWNKVIGPIFVYCNALADPKVPSQADLDTLEATAGNPVVPPAWTANGTALFEDALAQAKKERAAWPYEWVNGVDYPHKDQRGNVTGQLVLNDPQAATTKLPHLTIGLAHPEFTSGAGGFVARAGNGNKITWDHDGNYYQFWTDGAEDGKFTIADVRPGTYTMHAFADGVLGEYTNFNITVTAGKTLDLGKLEWKPVRYGKQIWDIGYPDRTGGKFFKGDGSNYWLWGWCVRYPLLFPNDITYTIGKSDYHKDWFFEQVPHADTTPWINPAAKDPANQRFGWVKVQGSDDWRNIGNGRANTWTIKFNMDKATQGKAFLRIALAGADAMGGGGGGRGRGAPAGADGGVGMDINDNFDSDQAASGYRLLPVALPGRGGRGGGAGAGGAGADAGGAAPDAAGAAAGGRAFGGRGAGGGGGGGGLAITVNGTSVGSIRPVATNALRYNTDTGVWEQYTQPFDAALLKPGENQIQLTVPGGDLTSGVVYDYLRLEIAEN
jgi:rhamnogalacturonan endolyase